MFGARMLNFLEGGMLYRQTESKDRKAAQGSFNSERINDIWVDLIVLDWNLVSSQTSEIEFPRMWKTNHMICAGRNFSWIPTNKGQGLQGEQGPGGIFKANMISIYSISKSRNIGQSLNCPQELQGTILPSKCVGHS